MMGGILVVKNKEKNIMSQELVREEWTLKPIQDMSEEEKLKLKELEAKEKELEEEKQKQVKKWLQELQKIRNEIESICEKFYEKLLTIHKKKLYYDMRVYEQELFIIRLTLQLHETTENKEENEKLSKSKTELEAEL